MRTKVAAAWPRISSRCATNRDAARAHAHSIEGRQPGLAQAGGQHHQAAPVSAWRVAWRAASAACWIFVGSGGASCSWLPGATDRGGGSAAVS
jgi:hypothetical protein